MRQFFWKPTIVARPSDRDEKKVGRQDLTPRFVHITLCFLGLYPLTGCLPYPAKNLKRGQVIVDDQNKLIPGETTRSNVFATYGTPESTWEAENVTVYVYFWEESDGGWALYDPGYFFHEYTSDPDIHGPEVKTKRIWKKMMSLLLFNDQDVLMDMKITKRLKPKYIDQHIKNWVYSDEKVVPIP
jgi:hypothetical protein